MRQWTTALCAAALLAAAPAASGEILAELEGPVVAETGTLEELAFAPFSGDEIWVGYTLQWQAGDIGDNNFVVLWFNDDGNPQLGVKTNEGPDDLDFMARFGGSGAEIGYAPPQLEVGPTYRLIGQLVKTGAQGDQYDVLRLWADPASTAEAAEAEVSGDDGPTTITELGIRTANLGDEDVVLLSNIQVGTTFAEVIPEPATMALLGLGGLALLRRRR